MKKTNLSWVGALLVFALLLWCTAATPGTIADPASYAPAVYSSMLSLLPPVVAIVLALNTKEVYTSLLVGIATGALLFANGNLELALNTLFFNEDGGMVAKLSDSSNVGILVFLVMLGILVALMNKAGGSAAFGRWASTHIHTPAGAQFATLILGMLIFVDDYFNCLTVGSVMRPVTDRQKVSRAKLAYLIDSTAAPICIIAPVSSWAAAVTSSVPEGSGINGFTMFLRTIPYNYYALLTIVMSLFLIFTGTDYCSMKQHEDNARAGDLFTTADRPYGDDVDAEDDAHGHVIDLVAPVLVLIAACIFGLIYTGGFFEGVDFITAFSDCNASAGLVLGSSIALMFTFVFYRVRSVMTFQDFAACIPEGFKAMVSPMLILSLAWTLSGMTNLLGAKYYVANLLGVSKFGEFEFWFAIIKIVAVIAMIVGGLAVIIFALPTASGIKASFANWFTLEGGFFPNGLMEQTKDGTWTGLLMALVVVMFSFGGTELIGITAGETEDPRRTIPRATNDIIWRILVFYIGALGVIMAVIPWNTIGGDDVPSPFVQIFDSVGIHAAAGILNFVCLTAVMSVYNSGLYANSRMLYSLAKQGNAPAYLGKLNAKGVPVAGVLTSAVITAIAVVVVFVWPEFAFNYLMSIATIAGIINWTMIMFTEMKFRKVVAAGGAPEDSELAGKSGKEALDAIHFKLPFAKVTPWVVLAFLTLVVVLMCFSASYRVAVIAGVIWLAILFAAYQLTQAKK